MSYPPHDKHVYPGDRSNRRRSFLDYGGVNSINRFASSYRRAQSYAGSRLFAQAGNGLHQGMIIDDDFIQGDYQEGVERPANVYNVSADNESAVESSNELCSLLSDGRSSIILMQSGGSTTSQTIFNSVNTLMGIGMLSLPYGIKLTGWAIGVPLLALSALVTDYTSILLVRIMKKNDGLNSYGDIAFLSGGVSIQTTVTIIFCMDLLGASISLIILTSQLMNILIEDISRVSFKIITACIVFFLSLLPLNILSIFSLIGVVSTTSILLLTFMCGFLVSTGPGSLIEPQITNMWPENWKNVLLALGLFLSPWGGHPVFPELFKDMRHPQSFTYCSNITFLTAFNLDLLIGVVGYVMFGESCEDSITKNLMINEKYPGWVKPSICILMSILSLAKLPLVAKPMITVYENILNIDNVTMGKNAFRNRYTPKRIICRFLFCVMLLLVSLCFSSFGHILAFLGSAICFTICITFPLYFYLRCEDDLSFCNTMFMKLGIVLSVILSIAGTYGAVSVKIS